MMRHDFGIYIGIWTNWSKGKILGATLTLDQRDGALLIACLALLVTFMGTRLWRITCYILHYYYSSERGQDALYHQRQVTLRNSETATSAIFSYTRILFTWKRSSSRVFTRIAPLASLALFIVSISALAGILSSRIASMTGQEVLIRSNFCGLNIMAAENKGSQLESSMHFTRKVYATFEPYLAQRVARLSEYAMRCYTDHPDAQDCHTYVKPKLSSSVNRAASCPFHDEMCRLKDGNVRIDTGYLNSHYDFGMNAPANERFLYVSKHTSLI